MKSTVANKSMPDSNIATNHITYNIIILFSIIFRKKKYYLIFEIGLSS